MLTKLTTIEKISTCVAALVIAACVLSFGVNLSPSLHYSNFIVGHVTLHATTKIQDILVGPLFIFSLFFAMIFFSTIFLKLKARFGVGYSEGVSNQLIWWSIPFWVSLAPLILGGVFDKKLLFFSGINILLTGLVYVFGYRFKHKLHIEDVGISLLSIFFIALIPFEVALTLGRGPVDLVGDINVAFYDLASMRVFIVGLVIWFLVAISFPNVLSRSVSKIALLGQLGLPLFFLTLYPAKLILPTGELTKYDTTIWLKVLVVSAVLVGLFDALARYRKFAETGRVAKLLSPISLFALLVAIRFGNTIIPQISPDDYHFGETLLGYWSYLRGSIPFVDYIPAHGLIDDDFSQFISAIFYDGTAGSSYESSRLGYAILASVAFMSLYVFTGSLVLSFVSTFLLSLKLSFFFLVPFLCVWFNPVLKKATLSWLVVWVITVPIVILGVPPQGLLLVAATGVMALFFALQLLRVGDKKSLIYLLSVTSILVLIGLMTPLGPMLAGAVRYLLDNGPINQHAYGIPWSVSWHGGKQSGLIFETVRMLWLVVPVICLILMYLHKDKYKDLQGLFLPSLVIMTFILLLVPYSMGRIDPGGMSRSGLVSNFSWVVLLPILLWAVVPARHRSLLVLFVAFVGATLNPVVKPSESFASSIISSIPAPPLKHSASVGLSNIGVAAVDSVQWDRLNKLNAVLSSRLLAGEPYLDMTSRNAQYFYMDRMPVLPITAPYNFVSPSQQKRMLAELSAVPKLALLEGDNITHDGGGLSLRNPYLYRYALDNYTPHYVDGFIIGYKQSKNNREKDSSLIVDVKNISDGNWDHGLHRVKPEIIVGDDGLMRYIRVGDSLEIKQGDMRKIVSVKTEESVLTFDGPRVSPERRGLSAVSIRMDVNRLKKYRASLFQRSFTETDLRKIPISWGQSEGSLKHKMSDFISLDAIIPEQRGMERQEGDFVMVGDNPMLSYDITSLNVSGKDADFLRFDFSCIGQITDPKMRIYWLDSHDEILSDFSSLNFTAANGALIVPLDASPLWLESEQIQKIAIGFKGAASCKRINVHNLAFYKRVL